ncbi:nuclear inhibitor of protein phosphatase 1 isoform X1 [Dermacentor silvarum]|uniref:nuclear inhibitor of protein phosphatase 1 isoform X1 n=1 Tax=Dermacentor silvarum TaxID=543639 RepID=UPI0018975FEA|nr:nuclear inhibitor of protein phosphatase 1 isoform X1 [Dermacentor silvarum]
MANHYDVPSWAGKPPVGLHLDVLKGEKLIQKLMIDEKKCYLFGRNPDLNDFVIDHQSCSRVHAALVYHKHLQRAFLVDLGSTHGTFIGTIRLEQHKPTQLPVDSRFHFGASTRLYILRERPQKVAARQGDDSTVTDEVEGGLLGLPETETELDNLTEYNTAHNRRITMLGIPDEELKPPNRKQKNLSVKFNEEEDVINPEDVDPSIGRFRNLVHTAVIPKKKAKMDTGDPLSTLLPDSDKSSHMHPFSKPESAHVSHLSTIFSPMLSAKLGLHLPNPAPEIEPASAPLVNPAAPVVTAHPATADANLPPEPKKKKYAKEAWPGKKPVPSLLM